jgi:3-oxochol-4-en-24-oyl-CoA dehydrogenase
LVIGASGFLGSHTTDQHPYGVAARDELSGDSRRMANDRSLRRHHRRLLGAIHRPFCAHEQNGSPVWLVAENTGSTVRAEPKRDTDLTSDVGVLELIDHHVPDTLVLNDIDAERVRSVAAGMAAAASGVVRWCVAAVGAHLRTREQFGKPIGTFQALQHKAAMLLVNSEPATAAAWDAVRANTESREQHRLTAATAAVIGIAPAPDLVLETLTMFGAIGFTWEHDLHLYWRRATSLAASIGPVAAWAGELGELARVHSRDMALNLGRAENEFRTRVALVLDEAQTLRNDGSGRQGDYDHFDTGPQRSLIADTGLIAPHWPKPWGLAATPLQQLIIDEEFDRRTELVRPSIGIAEWIMPTLLSAGGADLHERFVAPTLRGDLAWCQLFSEPGAVGPGVADDQGDEGGRWLARQRSQDLDVGPPISARCSRARILTRPSIAASAISSWT